MVVGGVSDGLGTEEAASRLQRHNFTPQKHNNIVDENIYVVACGSMAWCSYSVYIRSESMYIGQPRIVACCVFSMCPLTEGIIVLVIIAEKVVSACCVAVGGILPNSMMVFTCKYSYLPVNY